MLLVVKPNVVVQGNAASIAIRGIKLLYSSKMSGTEPPQGCEIMSKSELFLKDLIEDLGKDKACPIWGTICQAFGFEPRIVNKIVAEGSREVKDD